MRGLSRTSIFSALLLSASASAVPLPIELVPRAVNRAHDSVKIELWEILRNKDGAYLPLQKRDIFRADGQAPRIEHVSSLNLTVEHSINLTLNVADAFLRMEFAVVAYSCRLELALTKPGTCSQLVLSSTERQPLGWHRDLDTCVGANHGTQICASVLQMEALESIPIRIALDAPTLFPATNSATVPQNYTDARTGRLLGRRFSPPNSARTVLYLAGAPYERGLAHGFLAAQQVMDVLRFFLLEDRALRGRGHTIRDYEGVVRRNLIERNGKMFHTPDTVLQEARGIIDGIRKTGNVSLQLVELLKSGSESSARVGAREADEWDLVALSAYGQLSNLNPPFRQVVETMEQSNNNSSLNYFSDFLPSACSQFLQSGKLWNNSDEAELLQENLDYPIHARNMDGEVDVRKVTVSHVVVFAVDRDPREQTSKRFVSVMWPGFIGTFSAMNEAGVAAQMNFGCPRPFPDTMDYVSGNYSVDTQVMRDFVAHADSRSISPEEAVATLERRHKSNTGGVIVQGIFAVTIGTPFAGSATGKNLSSNRGAPARQPGDGDRLKNLNVLEDPAPSHSDVFFYEADAYGGAIRSPAFPFSPSSVKTVLTELGENGNAGLDGNVAAYPVWPNVPGLAIATNHYHLYRTDERSAREFTDGAGAPICNGMHVGFSSLWRYMSGMSYCAATAREKRWTASISNQSLLTVGDLKTALRTVDGGFTEHSIVFQPSRLKIHIAVASMEKPLWNAAYGRWEELQFADLFGGVTPSVSHGVSEADRLGLEIYAL